MTLKQLAPALRDLADRLDTILGAEFALVERTSQPLHAVESAARIRAAASTFKGRRKFPAGTHWTQKPENKPRLRRILKKAAQNRAARDRAAKAKVVAKRPNGKESTNAPTAAH